MNHGAFSAVVVCLACLITSTHNQLSQQQQDELIRALTSGHFGSLNGPGGLSLADVISPPNTQPEAPGIRADVGSGQGREAGGPRSDPVPQRTNAEIPLPIDPLTGNEVTPGQLQAQPSFADIRIPEAPQPAAEPGNRLNEPNFGQSPDAELLRTLEALAAQKTNEHVQNHDFASFQQLLEQNANAQKLLEQQEQLRKFQQLQQSFQTPESLNQQPQPQPQQLPPNLAGLQRQNPNPNQGQEQPSLTQLSNLSQQAQMDQLMRQFQSMASAFQINANQQVPKGEVPPPVVPTPPQLMPTGRALLEPKPTKPFFTARCKDCNIALGDKELLNFLGDLVEQQQQQQQQQQEPLLTPHQQKRMMEALKHSFDLTCDNCNVLVGGKEALVAAAENMFYGSSTGKASQNAKRNP